MEEQPQRKPLPARNPVTHTTHKRQVFWQITVPLLVGVILVVGAAVLVILTAVRGIAEPNGLPAVNRWANISLLWLLVPALILSVLMLGLLSGLAFGVTRLLGVLPGYARLVQDFFLRVQGRVRAISDKAVEPVLKSHSLTAKLRAVKHGISGLSTIFKQPGEEPGVEKEG